MEDTEEMRGPEVVISDDDALWSISEQLHKINESIIDLEKTINSKLGGFDQDNLNVTLFTDSPIEVVNKKEEK